jgi:ABC-type glycerol-3-phosphate transport system substrate-binding protein
MTDVYDDLGGVAQVKSFEEAQQGGSLDPFLLGRLAMMIDGNWRVANVADWKPDMDFIVAPAPMPKDQLDAGRKPVAWSGGFALVIPTTARQKEGAFKFIQFLRSWQSIQMLERGSQEQREAEGKIYLPKIEVNRVYCQRLIDRTV